MKAGKILTIAICSVLAVSCAASFAGCNNSKDSEESSKTLTSQNSEKTEESTESSKADESSKDEESGKDDEAGKQELSDSSDEFTEEELQAMDITDERISALTMTDEYRNGDTEKRKKLATEVLNKLGEEGFVIKDSIYADDNIVSFTYKGGALGGIQIKEFDPYMNGTSKNIKTDTASLS